MGLIVITFSLDFRLRFCLSTSRTADKPVIKSYNKDADINKKDSDDSDDDYGEDDDDDNNNNKKEMNNKPGRIFGTFLPVAVSVADGRPWFVDDGRID